jgi:hypothetical protein
MMNKNLRINNLYAKGQPKLDPSVYFRFQTLDFGNVAKSDGVNPKNTEGSYFRKFIYY